MSNSEAAFYQIINISTFNHVSITEPYPDMREKGTPAHSHACTQPHTDVRAIGSSSGEASSRSWLLMATGSRGTGERCR